MWPEGRCGDNCGHLVTKNDRMEDKLAKCGHCGGEMRSCGVPERRCLGSVRSCAHQV